MHYFYAIVMLAGLIYLRQHFDGRARAWWNAATRAPGLASPRAPAPARPGGAIAPALGQAALSHPLFGAAKPTSIVQLVIPRVELHLFYNAVVFTPMVVAMYLHHSASRGPAPRAPQPAR